MNGQRLYQVYHLFGGTPPPPHTHKTWIWYNATINSRPSLWPSRERFWLWEEQSFRLARDGSRCARKDGATGGRDVVSRHELRGLTLVYTHLEYKYNIVHLHQRLCSLPWKCGWKKLTTIQWFNTICFFIYISVTSSIYLKVFIRVVCTWLHLMYWLMCFTYTMI